MFFDYSFLIITLLSLTEIYGDFALRFYAQTNKVEWLAHGITGYAGVVFFLIQALKSNNVLYVNGLWDGISGLIESVAAYYILGDRLDKSAQYIGVLFVIVGIFLMKMDGK
jgi:multidrug transporter EmrE-like cation transporter